MKLFPGILAAVLTVMALLAGCAKHYGELYVAAPFQLRESPEVAAEGLTARYLIAENPFFATAEEPCSGFPADANITSFAMARKSVLMHETLPEPEMIRPEEFINYYTYQYPDSEPGDLFSVTLESGVCPWQPAHRLLLVGVQADPVLPEDLLPANLVFLVDNSGSMRQVMPLLRAALHHLADALRPEDRLSIVTFGGFSGVLLDSAPGSDDATIRGAIDALYAIGYTPGHSGIQTAFTLARRNLLDCGVNRVVLVTDSDFKGDGSEYGLSRMVEFERRSGITLSVIGMGDARYDHGQLYALAELGGGNCFYLDNLRQARNALVNEMTGTQFILAHDLNIEVGFDPAKVYAYRLIGFVPRPPRRLAFKHDVDPLTAIGRGHQITALYELVMADADPQVKLAAVGRDDCDPEMEFDNEYPTVTVNLRYRPADGDGECSELLFGDPDKASDNWQLAAVVTELALLMRNSIYAANADYNSLWQKVKGIKKQNARPTQSELELYDLVEKARKLANP